MKFFFRAKNKTGEIKEGTVEAANRDLALELIQKNDFFPISLNEEGKKISFLEIFRKYASRVKVKELMIFFRQLAIMIEARVPIVYALSAIKDQTENAFFKTVIEEVVNDIQDGLSFSDALKKKPEIFSNLSINIITAGETSGNLKQAVEYVADNIEKNYNLSKKITSAFIYPAVVMAVFFVIGFVFLAFIIPKLTGVIKDMGVDFPWYTQVVMNFSDFMAAYWWAVFLGIIGVALGIVFYINTGVGKVMVDNLKIKFPVFGTIFRNIYITRFAENLAILLKGGIPIIRAVTLSSSVVNNSVYEELFLRVAYELKVGGNINNVFKKSELISPIVSQMIRVGEETGQLDLVLRHIATFYEQETETATKNLSVLLEPFIMILIGTAVGFLVFSILMPVYNVASQIK
ncbi:type II secretion system F family protein [Patescibacteria group bacterium]|nr:type II secretion system F family protein [Patescibacteria group bacterium]